MNRGFAWLAFLTIIIVLFSGCAPRQPESPMRPFVSPEPVENSVKISLYFANADASGLVQERRAVLRKNESLEALVLRELIRGPGIPEGYRTVPVETRVISVQVVDRVAYANFSKELATRHPGGSTGEQMTISSIVYSLTELPGIEQVQFLLEGEKRESIFGHTSTIEPIGRVVEQPHQAGVAGFVDDDLVWSERSQQLAGPVTAVGVGNVTGSGRDIIAAAGGEMYLFSDSSEGYRLAWRMVFDRYVTGITTADLNGDGNDEIIMVGASSGNWNPNVPGFITVFTWQDANLRKLADMSKDNMPFWSTASMDITGNGRPEVLASNGNALYAFTWQGSAGLQQVHMLSRFAGTVASVGNLLAWRDANGASLALFEWSEEKWNSLWRLNGGPEWTAGTPAVGQLSEDGGVETIIIDLRGLLTAFDSEGHRIQVPEGLNSSLENADSVSEPVVSPYGTVVFGLGSQIVEYKWQR